MFDAHIICRFSSQDKEDASIERQKNQCLEVAKKLGCNLQNVKIIANDNLSGASPWDKRGDLLELESDIKQGFCKQVIVYRFDRLARDFEVSGKLLNLLKNYSIGLYDEGGNLDYLTAAGEAFFGMKSVFASFERRMIRDRMYAGKLYHFKQGVSWGGPVPLGLKSSGKKVVEDLDGMNIVNSMFNMVLKGTSINKIEQWTTANGISCNKPRKGGGICDWSIKGILTNRLYATGEYVINTQKEGKLVQKIEFTNPISTEVFDRVQRILASRTPGRPVKGTYLLSGLVYPLLPVGEDLEVDNCTGEAVSNGEAWGINPKIRFRTINKNGVLCYYCGQWGELRREEGVYIMGDGRRHKKQFALIQKDTLENKVWDALEKMAEDPKNILESIHYQTNFMETDKQTLRGLIKSKEHRMMKLEMALDRFYNIYGQTGDQDDFRKIQATKKELKEAREELIAVQKKYETIDLNLEEASLLLDLTSLALIKDIREKGSSEDKLALIRRYVNRVIIDTVGNIEIRGNFEVPKGTAGVFGRWAKGRVLVDTITSYKARNAFSSQVVP
jgi:DNA invertase Pin-like site-specific DNA recombinase